MPSSSSSSCFAAAAAAAAAAAEAATSSGEVVDPNYIHFLSHLLPYGKSYILSMPLGPTSLKYEPVTSTNDDDEDEEEEGHSSEVIQSDNPKLDSQGEVGVEVQADLERIENKDLRTWIKHTRVVNGRMVFEMDGVVVKYDEDKDEEEEEEEEWDEQCDGSDDDEEEFDNVDDDYEEEEEVLGSDGRDEELRREKGKRKWEFEWVEDVSEEEEETNEEVMKASEEVVVNNENKKPCSELLYNRSPEYVSKS